MATPLISKIDRPLNDWNKKYISPGPVGSVGDALTSVRIKQSSPDMPFAYQQEFDPSNDIYRGSNVQDGQWASFSDGGFNAKVKRRKLGVNANVGWIQQDISRPDIYREPMLLDQPSAGFKSQVASILKRQGDMFTQLPLGYSPQPGDIPRGNQVPIIQSGAIEETEKIDFTNQSQTLPDVAQIMRSVVTKPIDSEPKIRNKFGLKINTLNLPGLMSSSSSSSY
jgi:hypothetical protein